MARLTISSRLANIVKISINNTRISIGTADDNDIILLGHDIANYHAVINKHVDCFFLSTVKAGGTILMNNVPIENAKLANGDTFIVGDYVLNFEDEKHHNNRSKHDNKSKSVLMPLSSQLNNSDYTVNNKVSVTVSQDVIAEETLIEDIERFSSYRSIPTKLLILKDNIVENEHIIDTDFITIGRDPDNILVLPDISVAPFHAHIIRQETQYQLASVDIVTPVLRGKEKLIRGNLRNGDEIQIGVFTLIFRNARQLQIEQTPEINTVINNSKYDNMKNRAKINIESNYFQHPQLMIINRPLKGQSFCLSQPIMKIGRDISNDIVIKNETVSRVHAKIIITDEIVTLVDQNSLNGIEIRGKLVHKERLRMGDVITLGTVCLRYNEKGK